MGGSRSMWIYDSESKSRASLLLVPTNCIEVLDQFIWYMIWYENDMMI